MNTSSSSQKIIFVHIPRTGGTSFKHILTSALSKESQLKLKQWVIFPENLYESNFTLIHGHMNWPIPNKTNALIVSIVRNPVERIISLYKYLCLERLDRFSKDDLNNLNQIPDLRNLQSTFNFPKHSPIIHKFILGKPSITDFCHFWKPPVSNQQTKIIAGMYFESGKTKYKDDNELYCKALQNIEESNCIIGTTDNLPVFAKYCSKKLGIQYNEIPHINRTTLKIRVSEAEIKEILSLNLLDNHLYEYCSNRFKKSYIL
jgi:hypothetical protein